MRIRSQKSALDSIEMPSLHITMTNKWQLDMLELAIENQENLSINMSCNVKNWFACNSVT